MLATTGTEFDLSKVRSQGVVISEQLSVISEQKKLIPNSPPPNF
jgi:hypothetical protein